MKKLIFTAFMSVAAMALSAQAIEVSPLGVPFASATPTGDTVTLSFESTNQYAPAQIFTVSKAEYAKLFDAIAKENPTPDEFYDVETTDGSKVRVLYRNQTMCYKGYLTMYHKTGQAYLLNKSVVMSKRQMRKLFNRL